MAHLISINSTTGVAEAIFAAESAWHKLGYVSPEPLTSGEILARPELAFQVASRPIYRVAQSSFGDSFEIIPSSVETYRTDTGEAFGVVSSEYSIVQTSEALGILDGIVQDGILKYEAAFALRGGRQVCLVGRLDGHGVEVVPGDVVYPYIVLSTSHDGTGALTILPTYIRVVCNNTWTVAEQSAKIKLSFQHTGDVRGRAEQGVAAIGSILANFKSHGAQAQALAARKLSRSEFDSYLDEVLPLPEQYTQKGGLNGQYTKAERVRSTITARYLHGALNNLPGISGTAWGAFNAITEHVDHSEETEAKLRSATQGGGSKLKSLAWSKAVALAV